MSVFGRRRIGILAALAISVGMAGPAVAASCGNNAGGFNNWVGQFKQEAAARGVSRKTLDSAFRSARYATKTISLDRNQRSFRYSLDQFMQKRGANAIISKGRRLKQSNAGLFRAIEQRYGVPAGPLLAIWGMETGFGSFLGNQHTVSAVATLAYDCRRSAFFTTQLYALLELIQRGWISPDFRGAAHGEIGQTQFLPANVLKYGVSGDGNRSVNLKGKADALASTANFLRAHGWRRGGGYQPGQANFRAIQGWNAAGVYQKAIAIIAAEIDK
ncbi:lytic murein transglycosylase [Pseudohoeflea coraliihabitans]|uniref:Lytic murein transglycosylase n=1 Tax=Pseudohoeflea coraliihabitans TaxID=2860393 RepID=A0ABS6WT86_9HYPH|nr:lytic murein transglycosylase [Pseudohoeflea sp. DP4N28-3]MBW3099174.1 lytic murein transglycosylase [Pseudohoeflea sp. DP4N28-3]